MAELVLYTNPMSRGRIARWMLEEIGAPYRTEILDYGTTMKAPAYLTINPMGKVPAIRHGDTVVTECAAICAYLADAFPDAKLAPAPADRGSYYRWLFFAAGPLEAAVSDRALGVEVPPEKQMMVGYGSYALTMDTLEKAVSAAPLIEQMALKKAGWIDLEFSLSEKKSATFEPLRAEIEALVESAAKKVPSSG
jgi:glutathione S-transferase